MNKRFVTSLLLGSSLALAACSRNAPEELPPEPTPTPTSPTTGTPTPTGPAVGSQAHFENAVNGQNVIYFDTDQYDIDSEDSAALRTQAGYLNQYPNITVTVEGHTDERGTREYNLALGERRANAAKNFLVSLGIPESRIRTVSYGKERPVALGSNESAWAQNRRAVTVVVN
ncbi:peptidoglycan-associated lipoprotein Pal [Altererythrobacter aurantiacus]|uniref:Peptidoglycan-associated lipoprotein n=1 Tax=Parapontixanthobacter aurantiacus TaxID=1463599 RepID=A0A844ZG62_9SPHN|nr:peptidoglycan-associated lipoprotein Pal [Parapontixanthobacter aurantiacus]MXO85970.1 peptidoglycan-associated lipoprotein Pal [Parapontixanthobacter aurantiacus]